MRLLLRYRTGNFGVLLTIGAGSSGRVGAWVAYGLMISERIVSELLAVNARGGVSGKCGCLGGVWVDDFETNWFRAVGWGGCFV